VTFTPPRLARPSSTFSTCVEDEEWFTTDDVVSRLANKGKDFTEGDKAALQSQAHGNFGTWFFPSIARAAQSGQIEISTTPFYHPSFLWYVIPTLHALQIRNAPPRRAYRYPMMRASNCGAPVSTIERVFGSRPAGLWPSEGSVSDQTLTIAMEEGFQWFGTDEGVLAAPSRGFLSATPTASPRRRSFVQTVARTNRRQCITGLFRDHQLSDLIGFVYSRMDANAAAADLHGRLRHIGDRVHSGGPADGLYFSGRRERLGILRPKRPRISSSVLQTHHRRSGFSRAHRQRSDCRHEKYSDHRWNFPASWINANFDVWIGHAEDVAAWELLWDARQAYAGAVEARAQSRSDAPTEESAESSAGIFAGCGGQRLVLVVFGPEHSTRTMPSSTRCSASTSPGILPRARPGGPVGSGQAH